MATKKSSDRINEAFQRVKEEGEVAGVVYAIIETAYEIWERAECVDDFCVQDVSGKCIVFGGTNRVVWGPRYGWWIDKSFCTEKFIKAFDAWRNE